QQICCEQIEITARPESWPNVGPTLVGLTAADLPVIFWCRHKDALSPRAAPNQTRGLEAIMNLSNKVIIDTKGLDVIHALQLIAGWQAENHVIADLEWTRLTPWREPIAHIFDNAKRTNTLANFHTIEIAHSGERPASALYAAGWLSAPFKARVKFRTVDGHGPGIHSLTLRSDEETIEFERTGRDTMILRSTNGRQREYLYTEPTLTTLMTEELSIIGTDPAFNAAFSRSLELV
ncbi:MAG: glucose-6-phosphate dehydrogenase assembly protein OpcA, partial [Acidobacteriaceae bacterium]|nr:glucose-6-phosphate dehydrogenase assembly protein OpcA [Acidobacteriaceae bacterium]